MGVLAVCPALVSVAWAQDPAACWARVVRDAGITEDPGEIATFRFVGRTFHVPVNYLWRSRPGPEVDENQGIWILAWPPNLAPSTPARISDFWRNGRTDGVRITIFGHPGMLTTGQFLQAMSDMERAVTVEGERNEFGYRVWRGSRFSNMAEILVAPDPEHFIGCSAEGSGPNPICTARRTMPGPLRLQMEFRRVHLPRYPEFDRLLTRMMCCALDPAEAADGDWPVRQCPAP